MTEDDFTFGGGHTMQYENHVLYKCTLKTYIISLMKLTPINLIKRKNKNCEKI